ncbi:hypothetical protein GCM10025779_30670 [Arthrobacter cryoconiti]
MGLIDDEDFVAVSDGGKSGAFAKIAGVIHAAMAGRVNFNNVQRAGAAAS